MRAGTVPVGDADENGLDQPGSPGKVLERTSDSFVPPVFQVRKSHAQHQGQEVYAQPPYQAAVGNSLAAQGGLFLIQRGHRKGRESQQPAGTAFGKREWEKGGAAQKSITGMLQPTGKVGGEMQAAPGDQQKAEATWKSQKGITGPALPAERRTPSRSGPGASKAPAGWGQTWSAHREAAGEIQAAPGHRERAEATGKSHTAMEGPAMPAEGGTPT